MRPNSAIDRQQAGVASTLNEVTLVECSPALLSEGLVAVAYADGRIRLWNFLQSATDSESQANASSDSGSSSPSLDGLCLLTLHGHRSAVSALRYNAAGSLLASGGRDTEIVVWDPVAETGKMDYIYISLYFF